MNREAKRLLDEALTMSHQAVMALERFREGAHLAHVADLIASTESKQQIGEIYIAHLRCCWCDNLDSVARERNRALDADAIDMTPF